MSDGSLLTATTRTFYSPVINDETAKQYPSVKVAPPYRINGNKEPISDALVNPEMRAFLSFPNLARSAHTDSVILSLVTLYRLFSSPVNIWPFATDGNHVEFPYQRFSLTLTVIPIMSRHEISFLCKPVGMLSSWINRTLCFTTRRFSISLSKALGL